MEDLEESKQIKIVPTLLDEVSKNAAWCATFQLVWNDMQNELVKQDVVFSPQLKVVENLNRQTFQENNIEDNYYYKIYGFVSLALKEKIERGIFEKFHQTSDILDLINWNSKQDILFYTMLYRKFTFYTVFSVLPNGNFNGFQESYTDVKYFGVDGTTDKSVYEQISVLYYNSERDFAVLLDTQEGDQVLLAKGENGKTFGDIYGNVLKKQKEYRGNRCFTKHDTLKVPKMEFNELKEYTELENRTFMAADDKEYFISKALQTIKFSIDENGGEIKSEAAIVVSRGISVEPKEVEHRYFEFDSAFTMFLIDEKHQELPYFAANIDDIILYQ